MATQKRKKSQQNRYMKQIIFCLFLLVVLLGGNIMSLNAYFRATDSITNVVTIGNNEIEIQGGNTPYVANTGTVSCYVRVFAKPASSDMAEPAWNTEAWSEPDADGYRYYETPLAPENEENNADITPLLFTSDIPDGTEMIIYAESIQSVGFDSAEQAFANTDTDEN